MQGEKPETRLERKEKGSRPVERGIREKKEGRRRASHITESAATEKTKPITQSKCTEAPQQEQREESGKQQAR